LSYQQEVVGVYFLLAHRVGEDGWHHHQQQQPAQQAESGATAPPTSRRLLFVICYATFRATYSIVVTFTLLMLFVRYANR